MIGTAARLNFFSLDHLHMIFDQANTANEFVNYYHKPVIIPSIFFQKINLNTYNCYFITKLKALPLIMLSDHCIVTTLKFAKKNFWKF